MTFREFLLNESMAQFVQGGMLKLYHFASRFPYGSTDVTIDPKHFGWNSYTRNDLNSSSLPRTFFYLDPHQQERMVRGDKYVAVVPAKDVYDVLEDPLGIKQKIRAENDGQLPMHSLLTAIKAAGYKGVYYNPGFHVVAMFEPVAAKAAA